MKRFNYDSVLLMINLLLIKSGYAFNLSPIPNHVFTEPALDFVREKVHSSYFGYQINLRKKSVIIAAPRAQSTLHSQQNFNETGAIYKCKIDTAKCNPLVIDDSDGMTPFKEYTKLGKSHQWLGAAMDGGSNEDDILVVCAPNAVSINAIQHNYHGVCYLRENTINDRITQPSNEFIKELSPFRKTEYQIVVLKNENDQMEMYSYLQHGQMGHSIDLSKNFKDLLIGGPGVYQGSGSIVKYKSFVTEKKKVVNKFGNMDIYFPNKIEADSYFGYAVTIGYLFSNKTTSYAASAPRGGFVNIFAFLLNTNNASNYKREIRVGYKLDGEQLGEYYGYALLAENFNGDDTDDLVVGAPLYAKTKIYENGKVYVYTSKNKQFITQEPLFSNYDGNGRFGMALGKIGDINKDGYNDLAVGAPYEDNGKVYIFLGGRNGLVTKPSQIISSPDSKVSTFGLGLSKGVDIDANQHNDFAIGAPDSEDVYIFRSYPVIKIIATITPVSNKVGVLDTKTQFTICASYSTQTKSFNKSIPIFVTMHLDPQLKRASFIHTTNKSETIEMTISQKKQCRDYEIHISHTIHDYRPIMLEASYQLEKDFRLQTHFCDECVAVNPNDPKFVQSKIAISTGCNGTFCMADLKLASNITGVEQTHILGKSEIIYIEYTISNYGETAYFPQISIKLSQLTQFAKIPSNCILFEATLNCDLDNSMPLVKNRQTKFVARINPIGLMGQELVVTAKATSASIETTEADNIISNTIQLVEYNVIEIIGKSQPMQISFERVIEESLNITHEFEIINYGYSDMKEVIFTAFIPKTYNQEFIVIDTVVQTSDRYEIDFEMEEINGNIETSQENPDPIDNLRTKRETISELITEALQSNIVHIPHHRSRYFNCSVNLATHNCITSAIKINDFIPKEKIKIIYNITLNLQHLHKILDAKHNILVIEIIPKFVKINDPDMRTYKLTAMNTLTTIELIQKGKTPLFWIILSIIVGILVLAGVTYLLNRMGFFRRALKKEIVKMKRETMQLRQSMVLRQSMALPMDETSCLSEDNVWAS